MFFKRLAKAAPIAFLPHAFRAQFNSTFTNFGIPFGAIAAISGGISYFYYDSPNLKGCLLNEEDGDRMWRRKKYLTSKTFPSAACTSQSCQTPNPGKWIEFKLQDKAKVSHNTQLFRFLFNPSAKLVASCLITRFLFNPSVKLVASCLITRFPLEQDAEGKTKYVIRLYTPISDPDSRGHFDLLIKIAGGLSVTPMLQIIEAILWNPDDNTKISLLYANVSPDDILLKKKLDVLEDSHPNLKNWRGGAGYILKDMAVKGLPGSSEDSLILVLKAQEGKVLRHLK